MWGIDFTGQDIKPKMNGPIGISGWQTGPSIESSQQGPNVLWSSGEYTKIIGADHKAIVSYKTLLFFKILVVNKYLSSVVYNFLIILINLRS